MHFHGFVRLSHVPSLAGRLAACSDLDLMASTSPSTVAFKKHVVLPASHPQEDAADDSKVVRIFRVDRHLSRRAAWKVVAGGVVRNIDDGDGPSSWYVRPHGDIPMTVQAMKAGAVEFLTKPCRDQELLDAVRLAIERDRARRKDEKNITVLKSQFASLTAREKEILGFVTSGLLNKQIAGELGISIVTVKMHRGNIMIGPSLRLDTIPRLFMRPSNIG